MANNPRSEVLATFLSGIYTKAWLYEFMTDAMSMRGVQRRWSEDRMVEELSTRDFSVISEALSTEDLLDVYDYMGVNRPPKSRRALLRNLGELLVPDELMDEGSDDEAIEEEVPSRRKARACLYAIELRKNPKGAYLYVGSSQAHSPECKFSLHKRGPCICGATPHPRAQSARLPRLYGRSVLTSREVDPTLSQRELVRLEKAWACDLATEHQKPTWCDGRLYRPKRA